jgi:Amidohydrolase family
MTFTRMHGTAIILSSMASLCQVAPAQATVKVDSGIVLADVTVVNTATGALAPHQNVILENGKIKTITAGRIVATGSAQMIKLSGKFVVPGFVDMHAHAVDTATLNPSYFPLLLANGVTALREESVAPPLVELAKKVNAESAAGQVLAPEIIFQGVEEHQPPNMSAFEASNSGKMPSFDHLGAGLGLVMDCSTDADAIRKGVLTQGYKVTMPPPMEFILNPRAFDGAANAPFYQRVIDTYSDSLCKSLAETFAKNGTWQTLTLIRLRTQDYGNDPMYRNNPNLQYVSKERRATWDAVGDKFASLTPETVATLQKYYELQKHVSKLMSDNGVKILAGSDVSGVWLVAGFSLHQEFHELAAAGLTPLQVLQSTTRNAAEFLSRQATMGSVDEGKNADLVVLDANPVLDAGNLDKISGVVIHGKYLSKAELEKMKSDVAAAYK